jgi:hypothetical protein
MRFLKLHPALSALVFSILAEGICLATISGSNLIAWLVRLFHVPGALLICIFFPDVTEGYASATEELMVASICYLIAWLQWFFILLVAIHLFRTADEYVAV